MKWIYRTLRCVQIFIGVVVSLVAIDMLLLGGKIKLCIIAIANTTSSSPFSTDGQSNWILIFVGIGVIILIAYISYLLKGDIKKDDDRKDEGEI